jgi:hypothetical protein
MKLAEKIQLSLQEKLCPIHDIHPIVEVIGNELSIACCCNYFQSYCKVEAKYLWSKLSSRLTAENYIQAR